MGVARVELPKTLDALIIALCADYFRRKEAIEARSVVHRTDTEYRYYNFKIYDAAAEIVGERECELYIKEIGEKIGFAFSGAEVSEQTYKVNKRLVKERIATALHLV